MSIRRNDFRAGGNVGQSVPASVAGLEGTTWRVNGVAPDTGSQSDCVFPFAFQPNVAADWDHLLTFDVVPGNSWSHQFGAIFPIVGPWIEAWSNKRIGRITLSLEPGYWYLNINDIVAGHAWYGKKPTGLTPAGWYTTLCGNHSPAKYLISVP